MKFKAVSHISVKPKAIGDQKRSNEPSIIGGAVDESDGIYICNLTDLLAILGGQLQLQLDATDAHYDAKVKFDLSEPSGLMNINHIMKVALDLANPPECVNLTSFNVHHNEDGQKKHSIQVSWEDLVWSALMVGKSNLAQLSGIDSQYTKLYDLKMRAFMLRALLAVNGKQIVKSTAFRDMEASEKVSGSFWLGMFMAKLIAAKKMNCHFLAHFDGISPDDKTLLNDLLNKDSKQRPDLIGVNPSKKKLLVVEAKGTVGCKKTRTIERAKSQLGDNFIGIEKAISYSHFNRSEELEIYTKTVCIGTGKTLSPEQLKTLLSKYYQPLKGLTPKARWQLKEIGIHLRFTETLKQYLSSDANSPNHLDNFLEQLDKEEVAFDDLDALDQEGFKTFGDGIAIKLDSRIWPVS